MMIISQEQSVRKILLSLPLTNPPDSFKYPLSRYSYETSKAGKKSHASFHEVTQLLTQPTIVDCYKDEGPSPCLKKDCPQKSGSALIFGDVQGLRCDDNVVSTSALVFDLDGYTEQRLSALIAKFEEAGLRYILSGTHNDGEMLYNKKEKRMYEGSRFLRCVLFSSCLVPSKYHRSFYKHVSDTVFSSVYDDSCANQSRLFFLPRVSRDRTHFSKYQDGLVFDFDALLPHLREETKVQKVTVPKENIKLLDGDSTLAEDCALLARTTQGNRDNTFFQVAARHGYNPDAYWPIFNAARIAFGSEVTDAWIQQKIERVASKYSSPLPFKIVLQLPNKTQEENSIDAVRAQLQELFLAYASKDKDHMGVGLLAFSVGSGKTYCALELSRTQKVVLATFDYKSSIEITLEADRLGVPWRRYLSPNAENNGLPPDIACRFPLDQRDAARDLGYCSKQICEKVCPFELWRNCKAKGKTWEGTEGANLILCTHAQLADKKFVPKDAVLIVDELEEATVTREIERSYLEALIKDEDYVKDAEYLRKVATDLLIKYDSGEDTFKPNKIALCAASKSETEPKLHTTSNAPNPASAKGAKFLLNFAFSEAGEIKTRNGKFYFVDTSPAVRGLRHHQLRGGVCLILNANANDRHVRKLEERLLFNVTLHQRKATDSMRHTRILSVFTNATRSRVLDGRGAPIEEALQPIFKRATEEIREQAESLRGRKVLFCGYKSVTDAIKECRLSLGELGQVISELGIQADWIHWGKHKGSNLYQEHKAFVSLMDPFTPEETFDDGRLKAAEGLDQLFGRGRPATATESKLFVSIGQVLPQHWTQENTIFKHQGPGRPLSESNDLTPEQNDQFREDLENLIREKKVRWVRDTFKINGVDFKSYRDGTRLPSKALAESIKAALHKGSSVVDNCPEQSLSSLIVISHHVSKDDISQPKAEHPTHTPPSDLDSPRPVPNSKPTWEEIEAIMFPKDVTVLTPQNDDRTTQEHLDEQARIYRQGKYARPEHKTTGPTIRELIEEIRQRHQVAV